jgi:hypothetical protein
MSTAEVSKKLWAWKGRADAGKIDAWMLIRRALELRMGAWEQAVSRCSDPGYEANRLKEVLVKLSSKWSPNALNCEVPHSVEDPEECNVSQCDQGSSGSDVAHTITNGIEPGDDSVAQFVKAFAALSLVYEPSGVVERMALKEEWDGAQGGTSTAATTRGGGSNRDEEFLIPNLISFRSKLVLEAIRGLPDEECGYSPTEFRAEATTLGQVWRSSVCGESLKI